MERVEIVFLRSLSEVNVIIVVLRWLRFLWFVVVNRLFLAIAVRMLSMDKRVFAIALRTPAVARKLAVALRMLAISIGKIFVVKRLISVTIKMINMTNETMSVSRVIKVIRMRAITIVKTMMKTLMGRSVSNVSTAESRVKIVLLESWISMAKFMNFVLSNIGLGTLTKVK